MFSVSNILEGNHGVVYGDYSTLTAPDKIHIVQWTSAPCALQEETVVEGFAQVPHPVGTMVVRGVTWTPVCGTEKGVKPEHGRFYEAPRSFTEDHKIYLVQDIIESNLELPLVTEVAGVELLPADKLRKYNRHNGRRNRTKYLDDIVHRNLLIEKNVRDEMQIIEIEDGEEIELIRERTEHRERSKQ